MKIALGAAQFGLNYGITNTRGQVSEEQVRVILNMARDCGVDTLDTAPAYGNSERVIGRCTPGETHFRMVTKVPKLKPGAITPQKCDWVERTFFQSLCNLKQPRVMGLLMHHADDLLKPGADHLVALLNQFKNAGLVEKIGVSAYTPQQLLAICGRYDIDLLQCPMNVFDQRFLQDNLLTNLKHKGIEIHVRSVFLQGLLLQSSMGCYPRVFNPYQAQVKGYYDYVKAANLLDMALSFVSGLSMVDRLILGVNSVQEWQSVLTAKHSQIDYASMRRFALPECAVNPVRWR
jgi:aryl-alcohol dehydrogenase-like predicted oxidoreductase